MNNVNYRKGLKGCHLIAMGVAHGKLKNGRYEERFLFIQQKNPPTVASGGFMFEVDFGLNEILTVIRSFDFFRVAGFHIK